MKRALLLGIAFFITFIFCIDDSYAQRPQAKESEPQKAKVAKSEPIVITSNKMEGSKKESIVIFTGNVIAKKEDSTQHADKMEVYLDEKGEKVERIISTGNVKIVMQDGRTGTSQRAEYYDEEQKIILIGNAKVWQEENVVTGSRITIYLAEDRSIVESGGQEKVKAIFYPKKETEEPAGKKK